jgi:uncharacterized protein
MTDINLSAISTVVVWSGFVLGVVLGAVMQHFRFCTMGAVADAINFGDWSRAKAWLLAVAVALIGVGTLMQFGIIDPAKSLYGGDRILWLSALIGGLMFGFGMVLAGGCGSRTLTRIGGGSLKSVVVFLVMGLFAYMALKGIFGVIRVASLEKAFVAAPSQSLLVNLGAVAAWIAGAALVTAVIATRAGRAISVWLPGVLVGLVTIGAWFVSGKLGYVAEDPNTLQEAFVATNSGRMEALSFVAPFAYIIDLLVLWSDKSRVVTFGISITIGVVIGALLQALITGTFRWEGFAQTEDLVNHMAGGALMGVGGVVAGGCTFGQGISGLSMLSVGALIATPSIVAGAWLALKYQEKRIDAMV